MSASKEAARSWSRAGTGAGGVVGDVVHPEQAHMGESLITSKSITGPKQALLDTSYEDGMRMLLGTVDEDRLGRVSPLNKSWSVFGPGSVTLDVW